MRRYLSLLLFIGLAFWSCEQSDDDDELQLVYSSIIDGESYNNYIKRVMTDKLAIKIKLADLKDNYRSKKNKLKLSKLDKSKIKKYKKAYKKLTGQKLTI